MRANPILVEDYFRKEVSKINRPQEDDELSELTDHLTLLNQCEHLSDLEMKNTDIIPKTTQHPMHTKSDHLGDTKQRGNRQKTRDSSTHKHILKKLSP